MQTEPYPSWDYFLRNARPPEWVELFIVNVRDALASRGGAREISDIVTEMLGVTARQFSRARDVTGSLVTSPFPELVPVVLTVVPESSLPHQSLSDL